MNTRQFAICFAASAGVSGLWLASTARGDFFTATTVPASTTNFGYLDGVTTGPGGNLVMAVDSAGSGETVDGISFTASPNPSGTNYALTYTNGVGTSYTSYGDTSTTPPYPDGSSSANQATNPAIHGLLGTFNYPVPNTSATTSTEATVETLTISGLTAGQNYNLTLLDSPFASGASTGRLVDLVDNSGLLGTGSATQYQENTGSQSLSTLSFIAAADSSDQISFSATADDGQDGLHVYGFTVVAVPEPASLGTLLGVGTFATLRRRRRSIGS